MDNDSICCNCTAFYPLKLFEILYINCYDNKYINYQIYNANIWINKYNSILIKQIYYYVKNTIIYLFWYLTIFKDSIMLCFEYLIEINNQVILL
jgi:hypothetical protein